MATQAPKTTPDAAAASQPARSATPRTSPYRALTAILHNGTTYERGDTIELTRQEALPLLQVNAVRPEQEADAEPA